MLPNIAKADSVARCKRMCFHYTKEWEKLDIIEFLAKKQLLHLCYKYYNALFKVTFS